MAVSLRATDPWMVIFVVDESDLLNMIEQKLPFGSKITTALDARPGVFAELSDRRFHSVLLIEERRALHQSRLLASQLDDPSSVTCHSADFRRQQSTRFDRGVSYIKMPGHQRSCRLARKNARRRPSRRMARQHRRTVFRVSAGKPGHSAEGRGPHSSGTGTRAHAFNPSLHDLAPKI